MANYTDIQKALVAAVITADPTTPKGYPNRPLDDNDKPTNGIWLQMHNLRGESLPATLGNAGEDNHPGLFQIDVNYPRNVGDGPLLQKVDEIASFFTAGKLLTYNTQNVRVQSTSVTQARVVGGYFRISVTVTYYARTFRS